jgi:hypothetical protein
LFSCLFLVLNSALISKLLPPLLEAGPAFLRRPGVIQAALFAGPVMLIFVEWWLVDLVVVLVTPQREAEPPPSESGSRWPADGAARKP